MAAADYNAQIAKRAKPGDLIEMPRGLYSHWAVFIGEGGMVVAREANSHCLEGEINWCASEAYETIKHLDIDGEVVVESLVEMAGDSYAKINNKDDQRSPLPQKTIVQRAKDAKGEEGYNLLCKNCEHFVTWCRYGVAWSDQVNNSPLHWLTAWGVKEKDAKKMLHNYMAS